MTEPGGERFTREYDDADKLKHLVVPENKNASYTYAAAGRVTLQKLGNGTRTSYASIRLAPVPFRMQNHRRGHFALPLTDVHRGGNET